MRPQPELPPREGDNDATTADSDGEEEADPRLLLRLAIDDVRTAQAALLACLCETAAVFGLPLTHLYEQYVPPPSL